VIKRLNRGERSDQGDQGDQGDHGDHGITRGLTPQSADQGDQGITRGLTPQSALITKFLTQNQGFECVVSTLRVIRA